jgi:glycosyltransferase involved in cell wall biosynthesis
MARIVTVLPPREGFSPAAVGAVGMMVQLLAAPGDLVIGNDSKGAARFPCPEFMPVSRVFWPPFGRTERYMAGAVKRLRSLRPALVEVHNRANLARDVARALPGVPICLFLHNDPQAMRAAKTPAERAALLQRVTVVCVSAYLQGRFMQGISGGPAALYLPNALDLAALPPKLPPEQRTPSFLFVGRAVADKGADAFVQAFADIRAALPGWRAVMIGADRFFPASPQTPFLKRLSAAAAAAGVAMQGYRPHADVLDAMAQAAVVVVPSRWQEPFGLTALEAMASGAALICAPHGGLPEVAGDAALYAAPDVPGQLATAMLRLAQDGALRAGLAAAGLARARLFDAAAARARLAALRTRLVESFDGAPHTSG